MNLLLLPPPTTGETDFALLSTAPKPIAGYDISDQHDLFGFFQDVTILPIKKRDKQESKPPSELVRITELRTKRFARAMFELMTEDLKPKPEPASNDIDMFAFLPEEARHIETLIWVFDLHPDGPGDVPFGWVCDELEFDIEAVRRIIARNMQDQLKAALRFLKPMVSRTEMLDLIERVEEYASMDGWMLH